jgi:hypothetical protein
MHSQESAEGSDCTSLHCTAPHCTALHHTALHFTAVHSSALECSALHCTTRDCTVLHCTELSELAFIVNRWRHLKSLKCPVLLYSGRIYLNSVNTHSYLSMLGIPSYRTAI